MSRLSTPDRVAVAGLVDELAVVRVGRPSPIAAVMRALRTLTQIDILVCAYPVERLDGWDLGRFDCESANDQSRLRRLATHLIAQTSGRYGWFDPVCPEVNQRNVVVNLREHVSELEFRSSAWFTGVLAPMRLHDHHIERVLLCEGSELLGWFGALHRAALTTRQRDVWFGTAPAICRRLALERRLETAPVHAAALTAVFERIGVPALILSARGRLAGANESGRALLESKRDQVTAAVEAVRAGQPTDLPFRLTRLRVTIRDQEWLAVLPASTHPERVARSTRLAAARLSLTPRQREVLERLVLGCTNRELAAALGISERAVEQHVTAMLDRAGVDSRSALVSTVLADV